MAITLASNSIVVSTTSDFAQSQQQQKTQQWQAILHLTLQSLWQESNPGNATTNQSFFKKISVWLEQGFTLEQAFALLSPHEQSTLKHQIPQTYFKTVFNLSKGSADPNKLLQLTKELALANHPQTALTLCHLLLNENLLTVEVHVRKTAQVIQNSLSQLNHFASLDLFYQINNVLKVSQEPFTLAQWVVAGSFFQFSRQIGIQFGLGKGPITQLFSRWAGITIGTNLEAASLSFMQMTPQLWQGGAITFAEYQNYFWHNLITLGCIKMGMHLGNETFKAIHQVDNYLHITRGIEWSTVSKPALHYLGSALALTSAQQMIQPQRSWIDHWLSSQTDLASFFFSGKILQQVSPSTNATLSKTTWDPQTWNPTVYLKNFAQGIIPSNIDVFAYARPMNGYDNPNPSIFLSKAIVPERGNPNLQKLFQPWKERFLKTMLPSEIRHLFKELMNIHGSKTRELQQLLLQLAQIHPDPQIRPLFIKFYRNLLHQRRVSFRNRIEQQLHSLETRLRNKPQKVSFAELTRLIQIYPRQLQKHRTQIAFILLRAITVANTKAAQVASDGLLQLANSGFDLSFLERNLLHWIEHDTELHLHPILKDFIIQYISKFPERFMDYIDPENPDLAEKIINFVSLSQFITNELFKNESFTFEELFNAEPFSNEQLNRVIPKFIEKISQGVSALDKTHATPTWIPEAIWLLRDLMESSNIHSNTINNYCVAIARIATKISDLQVHHAISEMIHHIKFEIDSSERDLLTQMAFNLAYDYLRPGLPVKNIINTTEASNYAKIWLDVCLELGNQSFLSQKKWEFFTMLGSPKTNDIVRTQIIKIFQALYPKHFGAEIVQEMIATLNKDPNILDLSVAHAGLDIILSIAYHNKTTAYTAAVFIFINRCRWHPNSPELKMKANFIWDRISGQEHHLKGTHSQSTRVPLH